MGEMVAVSAPSFNRSIRLEVRSDRLSSDGGAIVLRELGERMGLFRRLAKELKDPRSPKHVTFSMQELMTQWLLQLGLGWRDQDDADRLREDAALRLASSDQRGVAPLGADGKGLCSQPTLSRLLGILSTAENRQTLREMLVWQATQRIGGVARSTPLALGIDVDSLPIPVEGHQAGAKYNGHYHQVMYHPLVASIAETRDLLDVQLRPGNVHSADEALDFILGVIDSVEKRLCQVAWLRIDAGFSGDSLLTGLEDRARPVQYVSRLRGNARLHALAEPFVLQHTGGSTQALTGEAAEWSYELRYRAESWTRERRVVLVIQRRADELVPHHFFLVTSVPIEVMTGAEILGFYRDRGNAEAAMGELMDVFEPALSSVPRTKSSYAGHALDPERDITPRDSFAANEALLLLNALAYGLVHAARTTMQAATGDGWSVRRTRDQILKVAARVLLHGRRVTLVVAQSAREIWKTLWANLPLTLPEAAA